MANPFDLPEILCLVCRYARRSDLAKLMSTSRLFFNCALPFVWNSIPADAPLILVRLLPGGDDHLNNDLNILAKPLDVESLSRFKLYTSHVKRLMLGRSLQIHQGHSISDRLLALINLRPILPNLEVLGIPVSIFKDTQATNPVPYISAYLSPTLVEIHNVYDTRLPVEPQVLNQLLSKIVQECPRLNCLRLGDIIGRSFIGSNIDANGFIDSLGQLVHLRFLNLGPVALAPKLLAIISRLPNLESLELDEEGDSVTVLQAEDALVTQYTSSQGGFPVLRRLSLNAHAGFGLVGRAWGTAILVRNLTSVFIRVDAPVDYDRIRDFARDMQQSSPFVNDLELNFASSWHYVGLLRTEIIDHLSQLPLRRLCLVEQDIKHDYQRCSSEQFALAFPNMDDLQIRGHDFTFEDLTFIAEHMHKLQYLSVSILISGKWPSEYNPHSPSLNPSAFQLCFRFPNSLAIVPLTKSTNPNIIQKIAIGLHILWPNGVTCVGDKPEKDPTRNLADKVNTMLNWLRESEARRD